MHCIFDLYSRRYTSFFVRVTPADRCGRLVIVADESHDLAGQILDRAKDAASYDLTLNFGKPNLYLIEPGGIGWGVVNLDLRVGLQEGGNLFGLMST